MRDFQDIPLEDLPTHVDVVDLLAETLSQPDIDRDVVRATILQLAGAPPRSLNVGADLRGDIHLAIVSGTHHNLTRFLSAVRDLEPGTASHLNGTGNTYAGVVGSLKGGSLDRGPILDPEVDLTTITHFSKFSDSTATAFQQIIDTNTYSISKDALDDTLSTRGAISIGTEPKYGRFGEYEPLAEQVPLPPAVASSVDLVLINGAPPEPVDTGSEPLPLEQAHKFLELARSHDPQIRTEATEEIDAYLDQLEAAMTDEDSPPVGRERTRNAGIRLAQAHARLRLADTTTRSDGKRAVELIKTVHQSLGINSDPGDNDADIVERSCVEDCWS